MKVNLNLIKQPINKVQHNICGKAKPVIKNFAQSAIPISGIPLVAYYIGEQRDNYAIEIIKFMKKKGIEIPTGIKAGVDDKTGLSPILCLMQNGLK